jgi:hypothetical protein
MKPFTFSAGQVTHQPTNPTVRSRSVNKFQSARHRRVVDGVGMLLPGPGLYTMKLVTPCLTGSLPVAIVVQRTGDQR